MQITSIQQQKRSEDRVNIFLDSKFWISLSKDELINTGIYKGQELSEADKERFSLIATTDKIYAKSLRFLAIRPRSYQEMRRQLLYKYEAGEEEATQILLKLTQKKLIDDVHFAEWFVENRLRSKKPRGKKLIEAELRKKGLDSNAIKQGLSLLKEEDSTVQQRQKIVTFIEKETLKLQKKGLSDFDLRQKLTEKLLRKGFEYKAFKNLLE